MTETTEKQNVLSVVEEVKNASFSERQGIKSEEEIINFFLDSINDFKVELLKTSKKIDPISEKIEALTWIKSPNEEILNELYQLIVLAKDLRHSMILKYVSFNSFRAKGIAKEEISIFKNTLDMFTEAYQDVESAFFTLPKNKEFLDVTKRLLA